jgi:hypothetical protein
MACGRCATRPGAPLHPAWAALVLSHASATVQAGNVLRWELHVLRARQGGLLRLAARAAPPARCTQLTTPQRLSRGPLRTHCPHSATSRACSSGQAGLGVRGAWMHASVMAYACFSNTSVWLLAGMSHTPSMRSPCERATSATSATSR